MAPKSHGDDVVSSTSAVTIDWPWIDALDADHLGQVDAKTALEDAVASLLQSGKIRSLRTGEHKCSELGDMVRDEVLARAK